MNNLTYNPVQKITITASQDLPEFRFVGANGSLCGVNQNAIGAVDTNFENGDSASVVSLGTAIVETAGAVAVGDNITCDADGKATPVVFDEAVNARALTATSGAGFIRVLLVP